MLLVRPFLELPKWQLEAACTEQGLTWANDPTNDNTAFLRNHIRALLSKPLQPTPAQQEDLPPESELNNLLSSEQPTLHQPPHPDQQGSQLQKQALLAQEPKGLSNSGPEAGVIPAILQVQRRCAAAHAVLSSDAIALLQASLQLPQRPQDGQQSGHRDGAAQQAVNDWSLAVKPFAEAKSDVALHALTAVMQARLPAATWVTEGYVSLA